MPVVVSCSACGRRLKVRDAALGGRVRCPACGETFVARAEADAGRPEQRRDPDSEDLGGDTYAVQSGVNPAAPASDPPDEVPRRRRRPSSGLDDEGEDRRGGRPHRGPLILILGILSVVLSCIPLAGWILGAVSMSMGSHDDRLMEERWMDRSGRGMTKAGQICGIFGVFLATVVFILALFLRVSRIVRF